MKERGSPGRSGAGFPSGSATVPLILMLELEAGTVPEVPSWIVMLVSPPSALTLPKPPFGVFAWIQSARRKPR